LIVKTIPSVWEITLTIFKLEIKDDTEEGTQYDCDGCGEMQKHNFDAMNKKMNLKYNIQTGKVQHFLGMELPCKFKDGVCDITDLDGGAYAWDTNNVYVFVRFKTFAAKMIKFNDRYFIIAYNTNNPDVMDMKIEVLPEKEKSCHMTTHSLYRTNFYSLYIDFDGGFDVFTGVNKNPINSVGQVIVVGEGKSIKERPYHSSLIATIPI